MYPTYKKKLKLHARIYSRCITVRSNDTRMHTFPYITFVGWSTYPQKSNIYVNTYNAVLSTANSTLVVYNYEHAYTYLFNKLLCINHPGNTGKFVRG